MCGKDLEQADTDITAMGSPPRVRERPLERASIGVAVGITPACAGKTQKIVDGSYMDGDHPRVCGKD